MVVPDLVCSPDAVAPPVSPARRLFSRKVAIMLARNTLVSCLVFAVGLALLWLLVEVGHVDKVVAAGLSLLVSNSLHYALGRAWIFEGSERALMAGYAWFLANAAIGMLITMLLFAALVRWTSINYLAVRVAVSLIAGLTSFLLNATMNFRRI